MEDKKWKSEMDAIVGLLFTTIAVIALLLTVEKCSRVKVDNEIIDRINKIESRGEYVG